MKQKLIIAIPVILVLGYCATLAFLTYQAKIKYDAVRSEYEPPVVVELTSEVESQIQMEIADMESFRLNGIEEENEERATFEALGLPYSSQGFADLVSFEPPPFDLFDMDANRLNAQRMILQQILGPTVNTDGKLLVKRRDAQAVHIFSRSHNGSIIEIEDKVGGGFIQTLHHFPKADEVEQIGRINSESLRSSP